MGILYKTIAKYWILIRTLYEAYTKYKTFLCYSVLCLYQVGDILGGMRGGFRG